MSWETIRNLIHDEWVILLLLLVWSVAGVAVICERIYALWRVLAKSEVFKGRVIEAVEKGDLAKAAALCETASDPLGRGLRPRPARVRQDAAQDHRGSEFPAHGRAGRVQALPVGARHRGFVGALRRPVRNRGRHSQGIPVHVPGGHGRFQGRLARDRRRPRGHRGRPLVAIYAIIAYNYFVAKVGNIGVQYKIFCEEFLLALANSARIPGRPCQRRAAQAPGKAPPS
jgi:hypothetical protein